jgi:hypothetical protein
MKKAMVSVLNFGDIHQKKGLCETINNLTLYHAYVDNHSNVVIPCRVFELGGLLAQFASFEETNWIEYTVQFYG